jgi:uncharacterized protein (DUF427 family)
VVKATWNGAVLAESDDTVLVEGNHYFPATALKREFTAASDHTSFCPWKGTAHYYSIRVNGQENANACWYYPEPKPEAAMVRDRVACWKGVTVA